MSVFVFLGITVITFVLAHSISDNPIVAFLGRAAYQYPEIAEAYAKRFHLNEPLYVQIWYYIIGVLQGNLGYSWSRGTYVSVALSLLRLESEESPGVRNDQASELPSRAAARPGVIKSLRA